jgi:hypothetical protein
VSWRGISRQLARCSHPPLGRQVLFEEPDLGYLLLAHMGIAAHNTDDAGVLGLVDGDRDQALVFQALDVVLHLALADPQPFGEMLIACDTAKLSVKRVDLHEDQSFVASELRRQPNFFGDIDPFEVAFLMQIFSTHAAILH